MTNNEIIFETVRNTFTPAQLAELVQSTYTAEQIAARRAAVTITVDEGSDESAENIFSAMLAADTFHTFAEWKRMGYSVKKGQHAALTCQLWKYTDKPGKAAREAAEADGKDAPETDPHFYMTKAHLFPAYRLVAQFADGQRLTFDGLTDQQAQTRMEAAQALHGDICWYDGVTDQHYENGHFYKLTPPPPTINMIDLTDYHEKEE